jgi:hypothetical protein
MKPAEPIADLVRRHRAGAHLAIDHPLGGRRYIAGLWQTDSGFVFADIGWGDPFCSGHPFHTVNGRAVLDNGTVLIIHREEHLEGQSSRVYVVEPDLRSDDPAGNDAARWIAWAAEQAETAAARRQRGLEHARDLDRTARL